MLLCVIPIFEGWDEYQHVAYIQYLNEYKQRPVCQRSYVSNSLLKEAVHFPQPKYMQKQLASTGAYTYLEFYKLKTSPIYKQQHSKIPLYQAQHGNFYYSLAQYLFNFSGGIKNLASSITILRLCNLCFISLSLILCFIFFASEIKNKSQALLLMLLMSSQPLYLLNSCRVANDSLAILLGTCVIIWVLKSKYHSNIFATSFAGILLGLGILTKSINMVLIPFIFLVFLYEILIHKITVKQAVKSILIVSGITVIILIPNIYFNFTNYSTWSSMQENLVLANKGIGWIDKLKVLLDFKFIGISIFKLLVIWGTTSTWIGGWSFLHLNYISLTIIAIFLIVGVFASCKYLFLTCFKKNKLLSEDSFSVKICFLILCMSLGLIWHMLNSFLAWGHTTTNTWYACIVFPFALALLFDSIARIKVFFLNYWAWGLISIYIISEFYSLNFQMIPFYGGGKSGLNALRNISLYHPNFLDVNTYLFLNALSPIILFFIIKYWKKVEED
jgi:hypothetical protein